MSDFRCKTSLVLIFWSSVVCRNDKIVLKWHCRGSYSCLLIFSLLHLTALFITPLPPLKLKRCCSSSFADGKSQLGNTNDFWRLEELVTVQHMVTNTLFHCGRRLCLPIPLTLGLVVSFAFADGVWTNTTA